MRRSRRTAPLQHLHPRLQRRAQLTQAAAKGAKNKRANAVAARRGLGQATPKAKRGGKQAAFQFKGSGVAAARVAPAARGARGARGRGRGVVVGGRGRWGKLGAQRVQQYAAPKRGRGQIRMVVQGGRGRGARGGGGAGNARRQQQTQQFAQRAKNNRQGSVAAKRFGGGGGGAGFQAGFQAALKAMQMGAGAGRGAAPGLAARLRTHARGCGLS